MRRLLLVLSVVLVCAAPARGAVPPLVTVPYNGFALQPPVAVTGYSGTTLAPLGPAVPTVGTPVAAATRADGRAVAVVTRALDPAVLTVTPVRWTGFVLGGDITVQLPAPASRVVRVRYVDDHRVLVIVALDVAGGGAAVLVDLEGRTVVRNDPLPGAPMETGRSRKAEAVVVRTADGAQRLVRVADRTAVQSAPAAIPTASAYTSAFVIDDERRDTVTVLTDFDVVRMHADGTHARPIDLRARAHGLCAISLYGSDGRRLAFGGERGQVARVYTFDLATARVTRLRNVVGTDRLGGSGGYLVDTPEPARASVVRDLQGRLVARVPHPGSHRNPVIVGRIAYGNDRAISLRTGKRLSKPYRGPSVRALTDAEVGGGLMLLPPQD